MNAFESEVAESCAHLGILYQKIPVACKLGFRGPRPALVPLKTNPYDSFLVHDGRHIALELKSQELFGRFDLVRIEPDQRLGLTRAVDAGARAWLVINMRRTVREVRTKTGEVVLKEVSANRAWAFDWRNWDYLQAGPCAGRKSIPAVCFGMDSVLREIPRTHLPGAQSETTLAWDLTELL